MGDVHAWQRIAVATCELCEAARMTPWHHEDDVCWVADCEVCDVPMVVWKQHSPTPPDDALDHRSVSWPSIPHCSALTLITHRQGLLRLQLTLVLRDLVPREGCRCAQEVPARVQA